MLTQPTIEKLCAMRLRGMAEAFQDQQQDPNVYSLSFEERLGLLIDRQWNWRQNRALERRLRTGRLQGPACVEFYKTQRAVSTCAARGPPGAGRPFPLNGQATATVQFRAESRFRTIARSIRS